MARRPEPYRGRVALLLNCDPVRAHVQMLVGLGAKKDRRSVHADRRKRFARRFDPGGVGGF